MKRLLMLLSVLVFLAVPAFSAVTGLDLLHNCQGAVKLADGINEHYSVVDAMNIGKCYGYLEGFQDGYGVGFALDGKHIDQLYCPPDGIKNEQLLRIVYKYLQDHPEQLNDDAWQSVVTAISNAFPCKK